MKNKLFTGGFLKEPKRNIKGLLLFPDRNARKERHRGEAATPVRRAEKQERSMGICGDK